MATIPASEMSAAPGLHGDSILLAEVLLDLAERAQAYTTAGGVAIALIRGKELLVRTSTGAAPEVGTTIPLSDGFISECVRTRKPLTCRDIESDSRCGPIWHGLKVRSLMAIPVCEVRDVKGMMLVIAPLPNTFQPTHISILMTLSDIIAAKLREHETAPVVAIPSFEESEPPAEFVSDAMASLASIFDAEPTPVDAVPSTAPVTAMPDFESPAEMMETLPAPPPPVFVEPPDVAPATVTAHPQVAIPPAPSTVNAPAATLLAPAVVNPPVATAAPVVPERPVMTPPTPPLVNTPVAAQPAKPAAAATPAPAQPLVATPPAHAPLAPLGSPALPTNPALAMMEEKFESAERDPSLLPPSDDPRRFKRTFVATTIAASVPSATAMTTPKVLPAVKPFVVAAPTPKPAESAANIFETPVPFAIEAWEEPREDGKKQPWLVGIAAVAAVMIVGAGLWMQRTASSNGPTPVAPVPAVVASALPPVAPAPASSAPAAAATKPPSEEHNTAKSAKPQQSHEAQPELQPESAAPAMEIGPGQARPKPPAEPDVPAPKLDLASNSDPNIKNLSRLPVAVPKAPKSELVPSELVHRTNPAYPSMARQLGVTGTVVLMVTVAKDGSIGDVRATDGPMQLRQAAIDAVKQWRYKPASLNGKPIETNAEVKINFTK